MERTLALVKRGIAFSLLLALYGCGEIMYSALPDFERPNLGIDGDFLRFGKGSWLVYRVQAYDERDCTIDSSRIVYCSGNVAFRLEKTSKVLKSDETEGIAEAKFEELAVRDLAKNEIVFRRSKSCDVDRRTYVGPKADDVNYVASCSGVFEQGQLPSRSRVTASGCILYNNGKRDVFALEMSVYFLDSRRRVWTHTDFKLVYELSSGVVIERQHGAVQLAPGAELQ